MRRLIWGKAFTRAVRKTLKKNPQLRTDIHETLRQLAKDPFETKLSTHKLKGKLSGSWACSIDYDLRIIFDFVESSTGQEDDILLIGIGSHDEVY
jgi:addiction module RelE/StbE family toxin